MRPLADEYRTLKGDLNKEQIDADQDAICNCRIRLGALRDALSLTDQAIAYGQGAVHHQDVKDMLV